MMALLTLFTGFVTPFIPDIVKMFQSRIDYAHELDMRKIDVEAAKIAGQFTFDTQLAKGDVDDVISARQAAQPMYGIKLLDALAGETGWFMRFIRGLLIMALAFIEVANGFVRPWMAYYALTLYGLVKLARAYLYVQAVAGGGAPDWATLSQAVAGMWDDNDWMILDYVLGFWLGARHRLKSATA